MSHHTETDRAKLSEEDPTHLTMQQDKQWLGETFSPSEHVRHRMPPEPSLISSDDQSQQQPHLNVGEPEEVMPMTEEEEEGK